MLLLLKDPEMNTARLIAKVINERHHEAATAIDPGTVSICPPYDPKKPLVNFLAEVGLYEIRPDSPARVIINERTGTIVAGENVTLSPGLVTHGNLTISVAENPQVSQPGPLAGGTTAVTPRTQVSAQEQKARVIAVPRATTVSDVARALNALGVTPRDLMSIFQAMKDAGMLHAELKQI